jgi:Tfp pilus assembly protein PilO
MKLRQLNPRERLLAGLILIVLVLGGYGLFRFEPRLDTIQRLERQKEATLNRLAKMDIPTEPEEGLDDIKRELEDQQKALDAIRESATQIEQQLAPLDSQELRVKISELARDSGIKIKVNEALRPQALKKNSRRGAGADEEMIPPASAGWITRMSPGSMFQRPLQRLEVNGDYLALRRFIHGLDSLPYQVTVIRLNIDKLDISPFRGSSQLLKAELILAL